jgi:hypothetical protein
MRAIALSIALNIQEGTRIGAEAGIVSVGIAERLDRRSDSHFSLLLEAGKGLSASPYLS